MHPALNANLFLVKEHVGFFKAANNYDIHDPQTGEIVMECREEKLGFFTKMLRFTDYKRMTPFDVEIRSPDGEQIVRVTRGVSFFLSKVKVLDENDQEIGGFKQKFFSMGDPCTLFLQNHVDAHHGSDNELSQRAIGRHAVVDLQYIVIRGGEEFLPQPGPFLGHASQSFVTGHETEIPTGPLPFELAKWLVVGVQNREALFCHEIFRRMMNK